MATKVIFKLDQRAVNAMTQGQGGHVNRMMVRLSKTAQQTVREVADQRITNRSGKYRSSIRAVMTTPTSIHVGATAPYAGILEKGSRPHAIVPLRARALAFDVGGRMVFARRVSHPGTRAYNIVRDGVAIAGKRIKAK